MKIQEPSRQVLEETPARVLKFLRGAGTSRVLAALLATRGYTAARHREGWKLLHAVSGFDDSAPALVEDTAVREAIVEIDAWDEPNFRVAHAALALRYPEQDQALFAGGLAPATGVAAVVTVKTFLDRVDALEKEGSKASREAASLLAERGITKEERKRMRALLATAESAANIVGAPMEAADPAARKGELVALYAWWVDWSEVARAVVKRRDHLIRLGLANRKKKAAAQPPVVAPTPDVPTPAAAE